MKNLIVCFLLSTLSFATYADQAMAYKVCALLKEPFSGSITFGGGDGCTWGLVDKNGASIESEKIELLVSKPLTKDQLKQYSDMWKAMLDNGAIPELNIKPEPFAMCEGGWKLGARIAKHPPTINAFYKCGDAFVTLSTEGEESVKKFDELAKSSMNIVK